MTFGHCILCRRHNSLPSSPTNSFLPPPPVKQETHCVLVKIKILQREIVIKYSEKAWLRDSRLLLGAPYSDVITTSNPDASYTISNISLEVSTVTNAPLASQIRTEYMKCNILYDRILRSHIIPLKDSDINFSVDINSLPKSFKGVLHIFTKERSATKFNWDTEEFYNP